MISADDMQVEISKIEDLKVYLEKPIVLLGGGQLGQMALEMWPNEKLPKPLCILDKSPNVDDIVGIECVKIENHKFSSQNTYVLSFFKETPKVIIALFAQIGQPIITIYDLITCYSPHLFTNGWSGEIPATEKEALLNSFDNPRTKQIVKDVISWREARHLSSTYRVDTENDKYNVPNIALRSGNHFDFVLDGGAFDAGFLKKLESQEITYDRAVMVEPDPASLKSVNRYVTANPVKNIEVCPKALFANDESQPFNANGLLSARIVQSRDDLSNIQYVNCITLSNLLRQSITNKKFSNMKALIKLHIEGAEWPVIRESINILKTFGEVLLFMNLSHDQDSLVKIPPLLKSEGFALSLYSHSLFGEGLTLTAYRKS